MELIGTSFYLKDFKDGACFEDDSSRILPEEKTVPAVTPDLCKQACFVENDYDFAGVQNGNSCWCGDEEPPISNLLADSECNKPCAGDQSAMCGAAWKNNVFKKSGKKHHKP